MNRLFEETLYRRESSPTGPTSGRPPRWAPAADAFKSPEEYVFRVEIPGVSLADVKLEGRRPAGCGFRDPTRGSIPPAAFSGWSASTAISAGSSRSPTTSRPTRSPRRSRVESLTIHAPKRPAGERKVTLWDGSVLIGEISRAAIRSIRRP